MKDAVSITIGIIVVCLLITWAIFMWQATGALMVGGFVSPDFAYYFGGAVRSMIPILFLSIINKIIEG
jgi:uncharacterized membrane protein